MELTEQQVRDLSVTGMIFGHKREQPYGRFFYKPNDEPLTLLVIRRHTNKFIHRPDSPTVLSQRDDYMWQYLLCFWESQNRTGGEHYEKMVAWTFVHARMNLDKECSLAAVLKKAELIPDNFLIPRRLDELMVTALAMENMQKDPPRFRTGFFSPVATIQYNLDNGARIDILVPLKPSPERMQSVPFSARQVPLLISRTPSVQ